LPKSYARQREVIATEYEAGLATHVAESMLRELRKACVPWKSIGNSSSIRKKGGPTMTGKNWIMIFGPNPDGTYVVEFRTAKGETLVISVPSGETRVLKHFQQRMPYGFRARDKGGVSVMAG